MVQPLKETQSRLTWFTKLSLELQQVIWCLFENGAMEISFLAKKSNLTKKQIKALTRDGKKIDFIHFLKDQKTKIDLTSNGRLILESIVILNEKLKEDGFNF